MIDATRPSDDAIRIRGARAHNLKNVDLDIPRNQFVVMTGPSGSGKSSLAFDTIYAEGQRQYIESLSVYARQFLHQLERPDVDIIEGLQPTICIDQRPGSLNPRSTVATVTEIYDYLRLLMARLGEAYCYQCGREICQQSPDEISKLILDLPADTKMMILAPIVRGRRGKHEDVLQQIRKGGFVRARIDNDLYDIESLPDLDPRKTHSIDAVIDRVIIRQGIDSRIAESVDLALRYGDGLLTTLYLEPEKTSWTERLHSMLYACPDCDISYEEIEPRTFSFNSPYGACPECDGLGVSVEFDPDLISPTLDTSLAQGAVLPWKGARASTLKRVQAELEWLQSKGVTWDTPLSDLSDYMLEKLYYGNGRNAPGVILLLEKEYVTTTSDKRKQELESYRGTVTCSECQGSRLRTEASSVRVNGKAIHEITRLSIGEAREFFAGLDFGEEQEPISTPLLSEIQKRLEFLHKVGISYLTLDRSADTLSGGELQRVRLASSIGSGLIGVCYVLDEPSIGLHSRDNQRLIDALRDLQSLGNTVLVVEHDEAMMRQADWLIDIGPGAGHDGGAVVLEGVPETFATGYSAESVPTVHSLTAGYLSGELNIDVPAKRRRVSKKRSIRIEGATLNNLKDIGIDLPLNALVCVTGVSGSGKSSLINETLARAIHRRLGSSAPKPGPHTSLRGVSQIDKLIEVDQSPIGRTPRSNPATYTGAFDEIRKVFAGTREAKQRGYKTSRFSFNVKAGRCDACQGQGIQKIEMNFLPDLYVTCDQCNGARFNRQTLQVTYKEKSIADVLSMPIDEGVDFFENFVNIHRTLKSLQDVGLGYLSLGQPSTTLSGGEAQRIKLATQLARIETGKTLYLLDEPTTGLHFDDIRRLLEVLNRLVDKGNTVVVIEHHMDVIKSADWIIDLGPDGGVEGGEVIATGRPEDVANIAGSHTGRFLADLLS